MFTPIRSADSFRCLNDSVSTKCVVVAQLAQEWTSTAGAVLSRRTNGTVFPDVVTDEDGKYPHAAPALRHRLQLQSLMNSGLVSIVTLNAPHKQLAITCFSFIPANSPLDEVCVWRPAVFSDPQVLFRTFNPQIPDIQASFAPMLMNCFAFGNALTR